MNASESIGNWTIEVFETRADSGSRVPESVHRIGFIELTDDDLVSVSGGCGIAPDIGSLSPDRESDD